MIQDARRRFLFTPCKTKADLKKWIQIYLGIDYPDGRVDVESTSDPMSLIWEIYESGLSGKIELGRILAYAARDTFKCVEKGTKLLSKTRGLVPIENVTLGETIWSGWNWQPVTDWIHEGIKDAVEMKLKDGRALTVSPVHRVWTWSPNKMPDWKKVSELDIDSDLVMVDAGITSESTRIGSPEYKTGYVLGILAGDGCTTIMDTYGRVCVTASDPVVKDAWTEFCIETCGRPPRPPRPERPFDYWIEAKEVRARLAEFGVTTAYSNAKLVPKFAQTSKSAMAGFLSGLLDTDGSVNKRNNIEIALTSRAMLETCLYMLNALGVNAYLYDNPRLYGIQNHKVHKLVIKSREFDKLATAGVKISAHKANVAIQTKGKDTHDTIPYSFLEPLLKTLPNDGGRWKTSKILKPKVSSKYPTVSRQKLSALLDWASGHGYLSSTELEKWRFIANHKWVKLASLTQRVADFYDLTVANDHSYWSNGIVSHNTLGAAVLEVLALLHMNRTVAHMAAIESQAKKSQQYVKKFFRRPYLRDFVTQENERELHISRHYDPVTKLNFTEDEIEILPPNVRNRLEHLSTYIVIVIATKAGANGQHASLFVCDEIEVVADPEAYEEAKFIPTLDAEGRDPITLLTSTRKWSIGLVQKEIDEAEKSGLKILHWNIIDCTEKCPTTRHHPEKVKLPIYVSEKKVKAISEAEYSALNEVQQQDFAKHEGYDGCLNNCKIFAACKGALVNQTCNSPLLKSISHVTKLFAASSPEKANAQLRCRKPSKEGMIYPNLESDTHKKTAAQMMKMITGEEAPENLTKEQLISKAQELGLKFVTGMDHGFSHNFAVCTGFIDGNRLYMVDSFSVPELEIGQKIDICTERIKALDPVIYPDPADPGARKTFQKYGFRCKEFNKARNSIKDGIDCVRSKILPALGGEPQVFFLRDDDGVAQLFSELSKYHWSLSPDGKLSDIPDDEDDDLCDAFRYLVLNEFPPRKTYTKSNEPVNTTHHKASKAPDELEVQGITANNFVAKVLEQQGITLVEQAGAPEEIKSSGNVRWII